MAERDLTAREDRSERSAGNSTSTFLICDLPAAATAAGMNRGWRRKWHGTAESSIRVDRFAADRWHFYWR
jgi:hypothetical protein